MTGLKRNRDCLSVQKESKCCRGRVKEMYESVAGGSGDHSSYVREKNVGESC